MADAQPLLRPIEVMPLDAATIAVATIGAPTAAAHLPAILSLATGVPGQGYTQAEIFDYLQHLFQRTRHARFIFNRAGVDRRFMAADREFYMRPQGTEARNTAYMARALPLGEETIARCLAGAGLTAADVDDFFVVSCTGLDIPGLDLRLAGRLGMRPDLRRTCVLGMGCYGAFPALYRAREAVAHQPGRTALVLALELCSLHLQDDDSLENMVVSALFADGAAAALIGTPGAEAVGAAVHGPSLLDAATYCDYATFDHMAFHVTDHGFQMRLSAYVPDVLAANIEAFIDPFLARNGLCRDNIAFWGVHPGGSKILDYLQQRLALDEAQMAYSRAVLRDYGNMSSPTILFVLDQIQRLGQPAVGDYGLLMAFGPGLTMEAALIRW
jgi:predicted naringenin-chalcone synthase